MAPFAEALRLYTAKQYGKALQSLRNEARLVNRDPQLQRLEDEVCMHSAATGQIIGFDGRLLQVLPANPDTAWLGARQHRRPSAAGSASLEFSSIQEALEQAQDCDVVQLLPGTHIVSQATLQVSKRIMITGTPGCTPQQVVLDHRANHSAFFINRSCILRGFTIDMVGFTEAILISGSSTSVKPILQNLVVACSGDDGIAVGGKAQPLIQGCNIQVRYCALKQNDLASTTLWQCSIAGGQHALIAAGNSQTFLEGCKLQGCSQEGVLGLQSASISLTDTSLAGCKGPAIDMSDNSSVTLKRVDVTDCQGGVWLWHKSSCEAICSHIAGGSTYAVLLDAEAYARGSSCTIDGPCHISSMPGETDVDEDIDVTSEDSHSSTSRARGQQQQQQQQVPAAPLQAAQGGRMNRSLSRVLLKAAAARAAAAAAAPAMGPGFAGMPGVGAAAAGAMAGRPLAPASPFGSPNGSSNASTCEMELCSQEGLVQVSMLVSDAAVAASLFPAEQGAFASLHVRPYPAS